jgi:hypothetical protein
MTQDPNYKILFEGEDEHNELYHYQWALARLVTTMVVDSDVAYVVASKIHRHAVRLGTATLSGLADTYQYDPVDNAQRLKTELHRPIQPGNTLRGYIPDLTRIKVELHDPGQPVTGKELISCMINGLRVPEYMGERNFRVHSPRPTSRSPVRCAARPRSKIRL